MPNERTLPGETDVTRLLKAWGNGDNGALDRLMPLVYNELRRKARAEMAKEGPGHSLQATELVHEAYQRLVDAREVSWQDRAHFFAIAAKKMREILVDHARARLRQKRGGDLQWTSLDEGMALSVNSPEGLLAVNEALDHLFAETPRKGQVVELLFFGGLTIKEAAEVVGVSAETVKLDWRFAKAWLHRQLSSGKESHGLAG
jgi:RNA polymerase sigma factor (TIGR02999 family)